MRFALHSDAEATLGGGDLVQYDLGVGDVRSTMESLGVYRFTGLSVFWRRLRAVHFGYFDARSLIPKLERVFGKGVAKDAGNPSGAWHFTISTAPGQRALRG